MNIDDIAGRYGFVTGRVGLESRSISKDWFYDHFLEFFHDYTHLRKRIASVLDVVSYLVAPIGMDEDDPAKYIEFGAMHCRRGYIVELAGNAYVSFALRSKMDFETFMEDAYNKINSNQALIQLIGQADKNALAKGN